jgi:hypothetical protein
MEIKERYSIFYFMITESIPWQDKQALLFVPGTHIRFSFPLPSKYG